MQGIRKPHEKLEKRIKELEFYILARFFVINFSCNVMQISRNVCHTVVVGECVHVGGGVMVCEFLFLFLTVVLFVSFLICMWYLIQVYVFYSYLYFIIPKFALVSLSN